ncbi:MAG: CDP-glucose 4,6-dehydratase (EC [uncultured Caballeronia sp.]|nr:MAG: CDP-glucose 4,6-dehydratase (EC [uncultured Caballeronia sp.]
MIDQAFWRGKKVFLTGHTGFKELADALFGYRRLAPASRASHSRWTPRPTCLCSVA